MESTVKLNGKPYKINTQSSTRAWMMYEEITGKVYGDIAGITDMLKYMYCLIKSNKNNEFILTFDEFIDETEKDTTFIQSLLDINKGKK